MLSLAALACAPTTLVLVREQDDLKGHQSLQNDNGADVLEHPVAYNRGASC